MENLFPIITGAHWKKAIQRAKTETNPISQAINKILIQPAHFEACIKRTLLKGGDLRIECRLGLWAVEGANHIRVTSDAGHYWAQYRDDGEYEGFLPKD